MIRLLLDFPWPLDAALDADPRPLRMIQDFLAFLSQVPFHAAPFVDQDEQAEVMRKLPQRRGTWIAHILRFQTHVACDELGPQRAIAIDGPADIRPEWERALRDQLADSTNWRTPQIVVAAERAHEWRNCIHDHEARIRFQEQPHHTETRVLVTMGSYSPKDAQRHRNDYETQKYAMADLDAWDVRHVHYPLGQGPHYDHCRLPRPQHLAKISLDHLEAALHQLRSESWPHNGRYWYIPRSPWRPTALTKADWRKGAFPEDQTLNPKREHKRGPVDYKGQIWLWDSPEGHWDVQLQDGTHKRITHEGICLD